MGDVSRSPSAAFSLRQDESITKPPPIALVGLTRQFFSSPIGLTTEERKTAAARDDGAKLDQVLIAGKTETAFVFCCRRIPQAIEQAFQGNAYGDLLARLWRWKSDVEKGLDEDRYDALSERDADEWLLWEVLMSMPVIVPPYCFTKTKLETTPTQQAVRARLALRHETECELWMDSSITEGDDGRVIYPDYDVDVERRRLYANLDADLLLRHVSEDDWMALVRDVESLVLLGRVYLLDRYGPQHPSWLSNVKNLLPSEWDKFLESESVDLEDWVVAAVVEFRVFPRVLRDTVENLQRCTLEGETLAPIVVYPVALLRAAWGKYLRNRLQVRFDDWWQVKGGDHQRVDPDTLDTEGNQISNHKKKTTQYE